MTQKTLFVLDTNILLHDPESLYAFKDTIIGIPIMVIEELDIFKSESSQRGFNAREVIRNLDVLRNKGSLRDGVQLNNGSIIRIIFEARSFNCELPLSEEVLDNQILYAAYCLKKQGYDVKFISKDINARIKADVLNIESLDYIKETVSFEKAYKGWTSIKVPSIQLKKQFPEELLEAAPSLVLNEFVILESQHNPHNYNIYRYLGSGRFKHVTPPKLAWSLGAHNPQQTMALDLLLDPNIQFVSLIGGAGTGKTFLTLLAALHKIIMEHEFEKMLISRPVIPLGADIGYLPGDIHEKLHSWMQPIYDNMDFITHAAQSAHMQAQQSAIYKEEPERKGKYKNKKELRDKVIPSLDDLIRSNRVSLEAITYMRGRSIPYQFIFIDEVQNLTPHEVKTIISRVGEGSKIVLAGDPYQIDSPYLDAASNGLVVATSKFKGQSIFGSVFLEISERSELSRLVSELM